MFIRQFFQKKNGKRHAYWALVESYRAERGPRQRVVAWLGRLDEAGRLGVQAAADEPTKKPTDQTHTTLFDPGAEEDERAAETQPRWVEVNAAAVRVENGLQFGGPWLALELVRRLQLDTLLTRDRRKKDEAILRRFEQKIEERLKSMAARCEKQRRDPMKVEREVGRLLGQNTRAARLFEVIVESTAEGHARMTWKKLAAVRDWATLSAGCYLLRTNVADWSDEELWKAYIQLTEAEAAFRIHKSDLSIRPIWHQKEDRVLAHILVCFLAYVLWKTLGQLCHQAGLGNEPRRVLAELSDIRLVDVFLPTREGIEICRRCVTKPTDHQQILLDHLQLNLPDKIKQTDL